MGDRGWRVVQAAHERTTPCSPQYSPRSRSSSRSPTRYAPAETVRRSSTARTTTATTTPQARAATTSASRSGLDQRQDLVVLERVLAGLGLAVGQRVLAAEAGVAVR